MAAIQRNPWLVAMLGVLVVALSASFILWPRPAAVAGEVTYQPLSAVAAQQIEALRRDAGLDDDVLAAANVTDAQLAAMLPALRSWYETQVATWAAARTALAEERTQIRHLESRVKNGFDETRELAAAQQQLEELSAACESQLAALRSAVWGPLSASQRTLVERMRAQAGTPMPYRVLDLTTDQRHALAEVTTRHRERIASARDAQSSAAEGREYAQAVDKVIGAGNSQALAALREYRGAASARVVAALRQYLPVQPEE